MFPISFVSFKQDYTHGLWNMCFLSMEPHRSRNTSSRHQCMCLRLDKDCWRTHQYLIPRKRSILKHPHKQEESVTPTQIRISYTRTNEKNQLHSHKQEEPVTPTQTRISYTHTNEKNQLHSQLYVHCGVTIICQCHLEILLTNVVVVCSQ